MGIDHVWLKDKKSILYHYYDEFDRVSVCGRSSYPVHGILLNTSPCGADCCLDCLARVKTGEVRTFDTGATRDSEEGKLDYEGFLSPFALERYAEYMHGHRKQQDGSLRASDNWQKGVSFDVYMKSLFRHFFAAWKIHRGGTVKDERDGHEVTIEEALCGILFNTNGYLHEKVKPRESEVDRETTAAVE